MQRKVAMLLILVSMLTSPRLRADNPTDSTQAQLQAMKERLDGVNENLTTLNTDVGILKYVKLTGYLQARYEYNDSSRSGVAGGYDVTKNLNSNYFYIRRGRLKVTFQPGSFSKYVFYLDASKSSVSLKEAFIELYKSVQGHNLTLTAGQMNWPFGYEIEYSSSKRDFPERSLAENTLFNGERDRGINFTWALPKYLQFNVGLFNGWGIQNSTFAFVDPTKQKDFIGRVKAKLGMVDLGASSYFGQSYGSGTAPKPAVPGNSTWFDANGNGQIDGGEVTTTQPVAAVAGTPEFFGKKRRFGLDGQAYLDFLPIGGTALRGEFYYGEDYSSTSTDKDAQSKGWYLWLSQTLGKKFGAAVRYDFFDPNIHGDYNEKDATKLAAKQNDATGNWSLAFHYFWDSYVRVTAAYDITSQLKDGSMFSKYSGDRKDNRFTLQFQFTY